MTPELFVCPDERLKSLDDDYLLERIAVNEKHLEIPHLREGAEARLDVFVPEARLRSIGRFAVEIMQ